MKASEKEILLSWVVNEKLRLDNEYIESLQRVRFRKSDITDFIEMILLLQRIEDFNEFSANMIHLLNLDLD